MGSRDGSTGDPLRLPSRQRKIVRNSGSRDLTRWVFSGSGARWFDLQVANKSLVSGGLHHRYTRCGLMCDELSRPQAKEGPLRAMKADIYSALCLPIRRMVLTYPALGFSGLAAWLFARYLRRRGALAQPPAQAHIAAPQAGS
jgi:hypothetical protein